MQNDVDFNRGLKIMYICMYFVHRSKININYISVILSHFKNITKNKNFLKFSLSGIHKYWYVTQSGLPCKTTDLKIQSWYFFVMSTLVLWTSLAIYRNHKDVFRLRAWDKEKILSPHEESNLKPSNTALGCSTTVPQRLHGERGLLRSSYDKTYLSLILFTNMTL